MKNLIRNRVENNYWWRLLGEMISAFILIFSINCGQALGEVGFSGFYYIYSWNILTAFWIGSLTFLSFIWMKKTTLSSNFFNLVINYKHNVINKKEFWSSLPFQFLGGFFAASLILLICISHNDENKRLVMGGTIPSIKGLFINDNTSINYSNLNTIYNRIDFSGKFIYLFALIQGLINSMAIIFLYICNTKIDKKKSENISLVYRYFILIIIIFFTTILYANTTNWIRLITPAIVSAIYDWQDEFLSTTLLFIFVQAIGLLVVYNLIKFDEK